jgi:hypothetical protein
MTFAPPSLLAVRRVLRGEDADLSDDEVGIVGGPSHVAAGTSYHLGKDQLVMSRNPYSARTARDKAGLSNAASGLDIDDDLDELRELSVWLVRQCRADTPDTRDIREIIYSPDGVTVLRWDRERGVTSQPFPDSDLSHRTHTHVSWYRDSELNDRAAPFRRFFEGDDDMNEAQAQELHNLHETVKWEIRNWTAGTLQAVGRMEKVLAAVAAKVDIDPDELDQIRAAASAGAEAGVAKGAEELAAALAPLLDLDEEAVKAALREVLGSARIVVPTEG